MMRRIFFIIGILVVLIVIGIGGFWIYILNQDPLNVIDRAIANVKIFDSDSSRMVLNSEKRIFVNVSMATAHAGSIRIALSMPADKIDTDQRFPVILVLGGLEVGRRSLQYIEHHGDNVLVAYEYPYRPRYWYDGAALKEIGRIRTSVLTVPAQVVHLVRWLKEQSWCDAERISVLGYSFGALFIPSVVRMVNHHNVNAGPYIMAYGGVNLERILRHNLKNIHASLRPLLAKFAGTAIRAVEPALHLPHLNGRFLLINGRRDHQIPQSSWKKLHRLTPNPKEIILLDAGHMHPKKTELTSRIIKLSREWLVKQNAINP